MQWYSYSRNSDFDKPRSIVHRCDEDRGGFEYEYCFAEYEYRVAEYDTNRKPSRERLFSSHTPCSSQNANCACSSTSSPDPFASPGRQRGVTKKLLRSKHDTYTFAVFFASLREPYSPLARPQRAMLRGCATGLCYGNVLALLLLP